MRMMALIWVLLNVLRRKMKIKDLVFISIFILFSFQIFSQTKSDELSILFYNVENLFDTEDNPLTNDEEFTPDGGRHWNYKKKKRKLLNLSKAILSASSWDLPTVIALCEVENGEVLNELVNFTPLKAYSYNIIHKESPDHRGIDVAFLYDSKKFYPLSYDHYPLKNKYGSVKHTREILYVSGILNQSDTIHFFVNHWPSRYGGLLETKPERKLAAKMLKQKVDELQLDFVAPKILILGDFNDQPYDESLERVLFAEKVASKVSKTKLYNLSFDWVVEKKGTLKYQSQWSVYDQIIVSGSLLNAPTGYFTRPEYATIIDHPFLLENDEKYGGQKPKRTYYGFKYKGGFSDHLPVLLKLEKSD